MVSIELLLGLSPKSAHAFVGDIPRRWCCVVGNEGNGISEVVVEACDHALTIEMDHNVDSLSLPVATGILLNGLRERETNV